MKLVFVPLALLAFASSTQSPEDLAEKSALTWLSLIDAGKYEDSWNEAASFFAER
jgi:hypothetical protein